MMRQQSGHERHVLFAVSPEVRHGEIVDFQASPGAEFVERRLPLGIRCFRLELFNESPEQAIRTIPHYRPLLRSEISGTQLWRELKLFNQLGVTPGQMAGVQA